MTRDDLHCARLSHLGDVERPAIGEGVTRKAVLWLVF